MRIEASQVPYGQAAPFRTVQIESDPRMSWPLRVFPVREAAVSPHCRPVSRIRKLKTTAGLPSPSTSRKYTRTAAASVPVFPKRTVAVSTVVASKPEPVRTPTAINSFLLFGSRVMLMKLGELVGPDIDSHRNDAPEQHRYITVVDTVDAPARSSSANNMNRNAPVLLPESRSSLLFQRKHHSH